MLRALVVASAALFGCHGWALAGAVVALDKRDGFASAHAPGTWVGYPQAGLWTSTWGCRWAGCGGFSRHELRTALERQRRFDDLRQDAAAAPPGSAAGLWLAPPGHYLPPPTPEKHIQTEFRERSVLRPEFDASGQLLR